MLGNKTVLLGVTGGIAAYKAADLVSKLVKEGANVEVIMTANATEFIAPLTFETLTGNKCYVDTFDRDFKFEVEHIELAKKADVFVVAPATANVMAKFAYGIADDMLSTTMLACKAPKLIVPAMNTNMYENPATQRNIKALREDGFVVMEPASGLLACKDVGKGKMPEPADILENIKMIAAREKDLFGKKIIVTAGATMEAIDPVRYITNHSTGKMGIAIARECAYRGAQVSLICGHTKEDVKSIDLASCISGVGEAAAVAGCENVADGAKTSQGAGFSQGEGFAQGVGLAAQSAGFGSVEVVKVMGADEMYEQVMARFGEADFVFKSAAVADYTPATVAEGKMKKKDGDLSIELRRTHDILKAMGQARGAGQTLVGFSMETEDLIANSTKKLAAKNVDMICANSLRTEGAGFGTDTNVVTFITKAGNEKQDIMTKVELAHVIVNKAIELSKEN